MVDVYLSEVVEGTPEQIRVYMRSLARQKLCGKGEECRCTICQSILRGLFPNVREFGSLGLSMQSLNHYYILLKTTKALTTSPTELPPKVPPANKNASEYCPCNHKP